MLSKQRLEKSTYNSAKIILTVLVVIAHSTRMYTGYGVFTPICSSYILSVLSALIYSFHMPAFVMLSGCIFGYQIDELCKYTEPLPFVKKKYQRLLVPYFCFGAFYVTPFIYALKLTDLNILQYFLKGIVLSLDSKHLWYILALFWIYCFVLLLRRVVLLRKWKVEIIIISVSLLLSISAKYLPDILQLSAAAEYQFYFIVGIYVNRHFSYLFKPKNPALQCISVLLCVAVLLLRVFLLNMFLSYLYALSGCILIFKLSLLLNKMNMKPLAVCILNNSYGIYLFHPMIVYLLYSFTWNARISPYFLSSAVIIFSFCISLGLTECMRKTKLRFAIGAKID